MKLLIIFLLTFVYFNLILAQQNGLKFGGVTNVDPKDYPKMLEKLKFAETEISKQLNNYHKVYVRIGNVVSAKTQIVSGHFFWINFELFIKTKVCESSEANIIGCFEQKTICTAEFHENNFAKLVCPTKK